MNKNPYQPINAEIVEIIDESPTIKSFVVVPEEPFRFETLTASRWWFTCDMGKGARIATSRFLNVLWRCCVSSGAHTGIPNGFFQIQPKMESRQPQPKSQCVSGEFNIASRPR